MKWNRFKKIVLVVLILFFCFFYVYTEAPLHSFELAKDYAKNSLKETGSINAVTGVYLDYRVYDSLFESLLLLVSAVGIHYLNKEEQNEADPK